MLPDSPDNVGRADPMRHSKTRTLVRSEAWMSAAMQHIRVPKVLPFLPVRSRLFVKYVALFVTMVTAALLANSASEIWFLNREHEASLIHIQHEQADSGADKISQFVKGSDA